MDSKKEGNLDTNEPNIPQSRTGSKASYPSLPSTFDPRKNSLETEIKDQGGIGICWSYSGTEVMSIADKKRNQLETVLSPNHYNYYSAENAFIDDFNPNTVKVGSSKRQLNSGGYAHYPLYQSLLYNDGIKEQSFATPKSEEENSTISKLTYEALTQETSDVHVSEINQIPGNAYTMSTEEQALKITSMQQLIYETGAITYSYKSENVSHEPEYYSKKNVSSYVPLTEYEKIPHNKSTQRPTTDHAVTIVGWDDTFSKKNFTIPPTRNGAFIVKNSWGSAPSIGGDGYFYVSYNDIYVVSGESYGVTTADQRYDRMNSYVNNVKNINGSPRSANQEIHLAANYRAGDEKEVLKATAFLTQQNNISYEVYFIDGTVTSEKFDKGILTTQIAKGVQKMPGMKEIPTDEVVLSPHQKYALVIKVMYPQDLPYFSMGTQEVNNKNQTDNVPILDEGDTLISYENYAWRNVSKGEFWKGTKANLFINAYTDKVVEPIEVSSLKVTSDKNEFFVGDVATVSAQILPDNATNKTVTWTSSNTDVATVTQLGKVTGKMPGKVIITGTTESENKIDSVELIIFDKVEEYVPVTNYLMLRHTITNVAVNEPIELFPVAMPKNATNPEGTIVLWDNLAKKYGTINQKDKTVKFSEKGTFYIGYNANDGSSETNGMWLNTAIVRVGEGTYVDENGTLMHLGGTIPSQRIRVGGFQFIDKSIKLIVGGEHLLKDKFSPLDSTEQTVTHISENPQIAKVNSDGKVTGVSKGVTTVTGYTWDGAFESTVSITVE